MNGNISSDIPDTSHPFIEQRWSPEELASLRAELDNLIYRVPDLSDADLEAAKEKLFEKITKGGTRKETGGFGLLDPATESGKESVSPPQIDVTTSDLSVVLHSADFEGFLRYLRLPQGGPSTLSPKRFSEALSMDIQTLAGQAHVHRNTISRAPESESVQGFLREVLRVLRAATDISGNIDHAIFWYRNDPLRVFRYKTAEQLVAEGRTEDVLRYVESLEAGAVG
jgi:hypothetical protein